jgi:DNA-binding NarL/FixJ family response regulator
VTDEIANGIRGIFDGQSQLSPAMATKLIGEFARMGERSSGSRASLGVEPPHLTERELEILEIVARGRSNSEIADELVISVNTVRNHIRNILDKLQMHSRLEAAMYAVRQRLIDLSE